jgi:hypothetical protein
LRFVVVLVCPGEINSELLFLQIFLKFSRAGLIESSISAIEWVNKFLDVGVCLFDIDRLNKYLQCCLFDIDVC